MLQRSLATSIVLFLVTSVSAAVRADLNPDNGRKDDMTPDRQNWQIKDGPSASQKFGEITVTLRKAGSVGSDLTAPLWKRGLDTSATMSCDGVTVKDGDKGGQIEMVIAGLPPGKHSIVTYHNNLSDKPMSKFAVSIDGKPVLKSVAPSQRVTDDYDAASAYVEVDAQAGKDVVIGFAPDGSGTINNIILNGFEIDTSDPMHKAIKPSPANSDEHAPEETVLSWTAPKATTTHKLYLGSSAQAVENATSSSPEFKGDLSSPKFQTKGLNSFDTYFWRVDEAEGEKITKGDLWTFRVRHLAFPGAEGYGRFARGGRGGRVIEVTNLDDSGPGSLREAVEAEGPRTVVFRVGGTIKLNDKLVIHNPYITVAGQTAPGDGICIRGATFGNYGTHDSIIRYVRTRVGDESGKTYDGMGFASSDHCIIDHCSISWTIDESVSSRGAKNITFQRNLIAEPLNMSVHSHYVGTGKGHSFAGSISGDIGSYHHNLLTHCAGRNWSLAGGFTQGHMFGGKLDIRNNVVYNWEHRTNDGGVRLLNLVGNYYIPGPASKVFHLLIAEIENPLPDDTQQYYVADNVMEGHPQYNPDNWKNGGVIGGKQPKDFTSMRLDKPFCVPYVTTQSAKEAYESVMADVGCNYPKYDSYDARMVKDVLERKATYKGSKTGIPGIIDSQKDVAGGWPELKGGEAPADADHDGMPDSWETANGLSPSDPADANGDSVGDGYTNLERYLNSIVARPARP